MTVLPADLTSRSIATGPVSRSQSDLGATDFLRLMTEQLKQQDPFAPTDNSQMVAQMAQMSASSGIAEMGATLRGIAGQLAEQNALLQSLLAPATPETPETPAT